MVKASPTNLKETIINSALELASTKGWANTSLYDIASHANISLTDLFDHFGCRSDILGGYGRMLDRIVLDRLSDETDPALSPRDRLFDILMERFDALNDQRDAVISILDSFKGDPKQALFSFPHLGQSMSWMLEAAAIQTNRIGGCIKVIGLCAIYLATLRVWANDDSTDMSKTMAALDKNLGRAEKWADRFF